MAREKAPRNETAAERGSRFFRNLNAVGAVALFGVGVVVPAGAVAFNTLAAINVAQVGGFEAARRHFKKKRQKKLISKSKKR
ncbi:MAG TPA: hypothetical protein VFX86_03790 [Candidatus Saccharimonadales bacterium]|nr:hypothetical protein [Candidatus Saccharimonadales bacterium]